MAVEDVQRINMNSADKNKLNIRSSINHYQVFVVEE